MSKINVGIWIHNIFWQVSNMNIWGWGSHHYLKCPNQDSASRAGAVWLHSYCYDKNAIAMKYVLPVFTFEKIPLNILKKRTLTSCYTDILVTAFPPVSFSKSHGRADYKKSHSNILPHYFIPHYSSVLQGGSDVGDIKWSLVWYLVRCLVWFLVCWLWW